MGFPQLKGSSGLWTQERSAPFVGGSQLASAFPLWTQRARDHSAVRDELHERASFFQWPMSAAMANSGSKLIVLKIALG